MNTAPQIRVMLVDDHPVVRAGYQRFLEQAGDMRVVAQAGNVDEAVGAFADCRPDVTVADLSMPGAGGLELIRRLLERSAQTRILVFTMHDNTMLVRRAFEVGACGFLSKSGAPEELLDAVRTVHAGQRYLGAGLTDPLGPAPGAPSPLDALTPREFEVFRLLARGASIAECARSLNLSAKTISNHQTFIKEKLGVATPAALVHLAIRHGVIAGDGG